MFGSNITLAETGLVTLIGMCMVFIVLAFLILILELFKYLPKPAVAQTSPTSQPSIPQPTISSFDIDPLTKAIIVAAILEDIGVTDKKQKIQIKNIKEIK